jgi:putative MATE family efflux protein
VAGAAVATIGTQALAMIVGIAMLVRGKLGIHLRLADLHPDPPLIRRVIRMGVPASVEQSTRAAGMAVMTVLVTAFGTGVLAAYGIGVRILSFVIIPALGFSMATSTLVGQAVGARRVDRAEEVTLAATRIAFYVMLGAGAVLFVLAYPLALLFLPDAPLVAQEAATFVRILCLSFGFIGAQQVLTGAFRGAGDTTAAMLLALFALWVLRFPLAFLLSYRTPLGQAGLWWAFPISEAIASLIAWVWFKTGRWRRRAPLEPQQRLEQQVVQEAILEEGLES